MTTVGSPVRSTRGQRAAAWGVHLLTATGAVWALLFALAAVDGDMREAFLWAFVATAVDAVDGTLARRFEVKRHLPGFDGSLLDNIIDYLTFAFVPLLLLHANGYLPDGTAGLVVAALPLLASCVQFCRTDAKTDDHLFWGFPSYWNVAALYVVLLDLGTAATTTLLLLCTALVFVPIGYLYPSRATAFRRSANLLGAVWGAALLVLVLQLPEPDRALTLASLLYVAYYTAVSLELTRRRRSAA